MESRGGGDNLGLAEYLFCRTVFVCTCMSTVGNAHCTDPENQNHLAKTVREDRKGKEITPSFETTAT